jgi:hypothetical protein
VDLLRQTTLMQCYNPPQDEGPTELLDGYKTFKVDGTMYLLVLNETTDHLVIVPTVAASTAAQSIRPVDLSKDSFSVTPSISKKRKKCESSSSVVLAEQQLRCKQR